MAVVLPRLTNNNIHNKKGGCNILQSSFGVVFFVGQNGLTVDKRHLFLTENQSVCQVVRNYTVGIVDAVAVD